MTDNTAGQPINLMEATQRGYFDQLESIQKCSGSYGEIGPDIGLFTKQCANTQRFNEFFLWEPNIAVHDRLKSSTIGYPTSIYSDLKTIESIPDGKLDLMVMIHVLDHLPNASEFLTLLRKKMKPNGAVLIVTHNEKSIVAKVCGKSWPAYCLQHPQLFNPKSITNMLRMNGFRTLKILKTSNYFPLDYIIKHALWTFNIKVSVPTFNLPAFPMKLGNMATIATLDEVK